MLQGGEGLESTDQRGNKVKVCAKGEWSRGQHGARGASRASRNWCYLGGSGNRNGCEVEGYIEGFDIDSEVGTEGVDSVDDGCGSLGSFTCNCSHVINVLRAFAI